MLNAVYQLAAPYRFEVAVHEERITSNDVVVRPSHLSICNADQRYYQGTRGADILKQKLPLALIHEGIGSVLMDSTGTFSPGDLVVMIPNTPCEENDYIAENYLRSSKFRGSSMDGFLQDLVVTNPSRLIALPEWINPDIAAFTEMVSVAMHAICRFKRIASNQPNNIGIWGDGNLGFITALLMRYLFPEAILTVIGHSQEKLSDFTFVDSTFLSGEVPTNLLVDGAFECAGGSGSQSAIDQVIDHIVPESTISLMGVSENSVPINTRMVLEKGLRLFGSSRSGRGDFLNVIQLYNNHPEVTDYLVRIVGQTVDVKTVDDIISAFEVDIRKRLGKTIIHWDK